MCVFFFQASMCFFSFWFWNQGGSKSPTTQFLWDYDNNSPSISSLMGCKGNVDTWRSDANRKTIGASVSLGFCWVPTKTGRRIDKWNKCLNQSSASSRPMKKQDNQMMTRQKTGHLQCLDWWPQGPWLMILGHPASLTFKGNFYVTSD